MAQPAPGWCDRPLQKPPIEGFVSQRCVLDTKRSNEGFWRLLQTTPVPQGGTSPPDLRRGARFPCKGTNAETPGNARSRARSFSVRGAPAPPFLSFATRKRGITIEGS